MMESPLWFDGAECRSCGRTGCCSVGDFNGIDLDTCFQKKGKKENVHILLLVNAIIWKVD